jgi:hypothetical protein
MARGAHRRRPGGRHLLPAGLARLPANDPVAFITDRLAQPKLSDAQAIGAALTEQGILQWRINPATGLWAWFYWPDRLPDPLEAMLPEGPC